MKYVIKNCPCYTVQEHCKYNCSGKTLSPYCQDCTDCVMKRIVELCKNIDCPCEYQGADCWECSRIGAKTFADKILKLLDIQEVDK